MNTEDLKLELSKINTQQQQWHDEFEQREKHWFWQRGFWFLMVGAAFGGIAIKAFGL